MCTLSRPVIPLPLTLFENILMETIKLISLKSWFCLILLLFLFKAPLQAETISQKSIFRVIDEPPVTLVEVRYEKLMRIYLSKIKLAFSETDDARSLEILNQFQEEFNQKTDVLKDELRVLVEGLSPKQAEILYDRLSEKSHTEELVALLFDERVTGRMAANAALKQVMDQLHAKSLEVEKSEKEFIAASR